MDLIFEKAKDEALWSTLYADLCQKILSRRNMLPNDSTARPQNIRITDDKCLLQYLTRICRTAFDNGWSTRQRNVENHEDTTNSATGSRDPELEVVYRSFEFSDAYYTEQRSKRRGLGLLKFVGELFSRDLIETEDIEYMLRTLLEDPKPREETVESICRLLSVAGFKLECNGLETLDLCIERVKILQVDTRLGSRLRFMLNVSTCPFRPPWLLILTYLLKPHYRMSFLCETIVGSQRRLQ